jgi:hypothetical protein
MNFRSNGIRSNGVRSNGVSGKWLFGRKFLVKLFFGKVIQNLSCPENGFIVLNHRSIKFLEHILGCRDSKIRDKKGKNKIFAVGRLAHQFFFLNLGKFLPPDFIFVNTIILIED